MSASVDSGTRAVIDCALLLHLLRVKLINLDTARNEVRVLKYAPPRYDAPPRAHGQLSLFTASAQVLSGVKTYGAPKYRSRSAAQPCSP